MTTLLTIIAVFLVLLVLGQVLRIYEVSAKLKGREVYEVTPTEGKVNAALMLVFLVAYAGFFVWQINKWGKYLLPEPASVHGVITDNLFLTTWWIIIPVGILCHIILFYFAFKYVYNENRRADFFAHSNKLELIWTVVPTIVFDYSYSLWSQCLE